MEGSERDTLTHPLPSAHAHKPRYGAAPPHLFFQCIAAPAGATARAHTSRPLSPPLPPRCRLRTRPLSRHLRSRRHRRRRHHPTASARPHLSTIPPSTRLPFAAIAPCCTRARTDRCSAAPLAVGCSAAPLLLLPPPPPPRAPTIDARALARQQRTQATCGAGRGLESSGAPSCGGFHTTRARVRGGTPLGALDTYIAPPPLEAWGAVLVLQPSRPQQPTCTGPGVAR